jgi:hypothetical protein
MEWLEQLPEVLREAPFIGKADSPEDALAKIQHAANTVGRSVRFPDEETSDEKRAEFYQKIAEAVPDIVRMPTDDEDPEQAAAFNARFGVPEKAEDFALPEVENWEWDGAYAATMRENALAAGMNQRQFERYAKGLAIAGLKADEVAAIAIEEAKSALKAEWGAAYEERTAMIDKYLEMSKAPEQLRDMAKNGDMDAATMQWMYEAADSFKSEMGNLTIRDKLKEAPLTPMEVQEKINDIVKDPNYFKAGSVEQRVLVDRMAKYQAMLVA